MIPRCSVGLGPDLRGVRHNQSVPFFAVGQAATGVISARVAALADGVLKAMLLTKLKTVTAVDDAKRGYAHDCDSGVRPNGRQEYQHKHPCAEDREAGGAAKKPAEKFHELRPRSKATK